MKKVGTISAALGYIFIGILLIIRKTNYPLSLEIYKFWPFIIIVLGIEVIISNFKVNKKARFEFLVLPIIIIFLMLDFYNLTFNFLGKNKPFDFGNAIDKFDTYEKSFKEFDFDDSNKKIECTKEIQSNGNVLNVYGKNIKLFIKKSNSPTIKVESDVYVDDNIKSYDINIKSDDKGYILNINDFFIKKSQTTIYIPDNMTININADNLFVRNDSEFLNSTFNVNSSNCSVNLDEVKAANVLFKDCSFKLSDVKNVNLNGNNTDGNIYGEIENLNFNANMCNIGVNSAQFKIASINSDKGKIDFTTSAKNLGANIKIVDGKCIVNKETIYNKEYTKTLGKGDNKVLINLKQGTVNLKYK